MHLIDTNFLTRNRGYNEVFSLIPCDKHRHTDSNQSFPVFSNRTQSSYRQMELGFFARVGVCFFSLTTVLIHKSELITYNLKEHNPSLKLHVGPLVGTQYT